MLGFDPFSSITIFHHEASYSLEKEKKESCEVDSNEDIYYLVQILKYRHIVGLTKVNSNQ